MADNRLPDELTGALKTKFTGIEVNERQDITLLPDDLIPLMKELKENPDYAMDFLTSIKAVDYQDRFEVVYNLVSLEYGYTLMVKVKIVEKQNPALPSLCALWGGANWQEREAYDLMGISFTGYPGHPTRILLNEDFEGYPLRKDYQWKSSREG